MVRTLQFTSFVEPVRRGITQPLIIRAQAEDGECETVFLKTVAGYGDRPRAVGLELFTTLIARQLGLKAPEPVLVEVPENAGRLVHDAPRHAALLSQSPGLNFGTVALGNDWKVWLPELSIRSFSAQDVELILAFDGLVQHTDREAGNPNLMWRGGEMAILDHEKVFGYLPTAAEDERPWRIFFQSRPFARHVLAAAGRNLLHADFGKTLWENVLEMHWGGGFDRCQKAAEAAFPASQVDLARVHAYLSRLADQAGDFFEFLKASLQR